MPEVRPFRGIYYNPKFVPNLSDVITPPYDNIPDEDVPKYLNRSPYNFAHIILPREEAEPYTHATHLLTEWREKKLFVEDSQPGFYLYQQKFEWLGKSHTRHSVMAAVQLSPFSEGKILPHEITHGSHREDRLRILRKTRTNLSHIFAMVNDSSSTLRQMEGETQFREPLHHTTTEDKVEHVVWKIAQEWNERLIALFREHPLYILDGHHRYSSALQYAQEQGAVGKENDPAAYMLFSISSCNDPGLRVLPTHREVVSGVPHPFPWEALEKEFTVEPADEMALKKLVSEPVDRPEFFLWLEKKLLRLHPRDWKNPKEDIKPALAKFPVYWSDNPLLRDIVGIPEGERVKRIRYHKSWETLWNNRQNVSLAVFHAPPAISAMTAIADEGSFMPQKSTFFYPKLAAGLLLRDIGAPLGEG